MIFMTWVISRSCDKNICNSIHIYLQLDFKKYLVAVYSETNYEVSDDDLVVVFEYDYFTGLETVLNAYSKR